MYSLNVIVFLSGAAVMAIEIVAARIMSPYFGNSIVVWTSLIGVIMAALSLGYWQGGRIADKNPTFARLSLLLVLAGVLVAFTAFSKNFFLAYISEIPELHIASTMAEIVLFAPASFILAMVTPYVVRLQLKEIESSGETVGSLYAVSTIGSIVGTFGAGFILLALIGSTAILLCTSALLFVASVISSLKAYLRVRAGALVLAAVFALAAPTTSGTFIAGKLRFETDTQYNHALVYDTVDTNTRRPIRSLFIDRFARQSSIFTDKDDGPVLDYQKYFRLGQHFDPDARRYLLLGGGAFNYVSEFFRRVPSGLLDVVELDPGFPVIAQKYFGLRSHPDLLIIPADARSYLNRSTKKYDVIYVDVFGSREIVPFYMTTQETARRLFEMLGTHGLVVMNVLSEIEGTRGRFLRAEFATYKSIFPRVEMFNLGARSEAFQNVMLVAFKDPAEPVWASDDPDIAAYLSHRWTKGLENDTPILRDDFAPVEVYRMEGYEHLFEFAQIINKKFRNWF
jgi:predicted membrane-bound spermidine synthase